MLLPRIIPCLLLTNEGLVKTENFKNPKYIGDPINTVKIFNEKKADELMLIDISATRNGTEPDFSFIKKIAYECRMPFCYGGGIKNLSHIKDLISLGVEKVSISSSAIKNFSLIADASKVVGNQSIVLVLDKQKERFIQGAIKNGITKDVANFVFTKIEPFAQYGFNKSHAAAYAMIAYQTAFLKTYYKEDFIAATMTTELTNTSKLREFVEELKRLKVEIIRPSINECFAEFKAEGGKIYYGLGAIKNVGFEAISNIVREREKNGKFESLENFIKRVDTKDVNKLQLEGLTKAGAFDEFDKDRNKIFISIPKIIQQIKNINDDKSNNQSNLFENTEGQSNRFEYLKSKSWKPKELLSEEFRSLGFYISDHPLSEYEEIFKQLKIINFNKFIENNYSEGLVAGTVMSIQEKKSAKGIPYAIIKFSDQKGEFELFLFSEILISNRDKLKESESFILTLQKDKVSGDISRRRVNVKKILSLDEVVEEPYSKVTIELKENFQISDIKDILSKRGNTKINLVINKNNQKAYYSLQNNRKFDLSHYNHLKSMEYVVKITV